MPHKTFWREPRSNEVLRPVLRIELPTTVRLSRLSRLAKNGWLEPWLGSHLAAAISTALIFTLVWNLGHPVPENYNAFL